MAADSTEFLYYMVLHAAAALANSSVTPLRFLAPPPSPDGSRRRLRLRDGWNIAGNLHTLGYFAGATAHLHL